ncbi:hypothetical protein B7463_g8842, partial [Scytalidium lignicola]
MTPTSVCPVPADYPPEIIGCRGRFQLARPGSFAIVESLGLKSNDTGIHMSLFIQPFLPESGHLQTLVSNLDTGNKTGVAVVINTTGEIEVWVGTGNNVEVVKSRFMPTKSRWTGIDLKVEDKEVDIIFTPKAQVLESAQLKKVSNATLKDAVLFASSSPLLIAGGYASSSTTSSPYVTSFYNGRIDSLCLETLGSKARMLATYDFARQISSDSIIDTSVASRHGLLVNAPSRAMKGHDWDGSEVDWTKAKYGYGAIHFHEDDLDDACWETDFKITIPEDARSGAYAVELGSKVALVMSTFTYLSYANEHMWDMTSPARLEVPNPDFTPLKDINYLKSTRRSDLGLSCYDVHKDLTGVIFSSSKRPILNLKPDYIHWALHRPREFSADMLMLAFLERSGIAYDVLTDHELHENGVSALTPYTTAITGCHPEYPSLESYSAYIGFAAQGGNLMYLGGNGFYWVSATDMLARPHRLEVRRGEQGVRTSFQQPGERMHSLNGTHGGLWRGRGRACNYLFGIGCCGEGTGPGVAYLPSPGILKGYPEVAFILDGVGETELIGEFGYGGGASGDEIDRYDEQYGSPKNAVVVASSVGHPDDFGLFPEDSGFPMKETLGTQTKLIRSDVVWYRTSSGGAVFSVGSINWYSSLGWDNYQNGVARITGNVLREFAKRKGQHVSDRWPQSKI